MDDVEAMDRALALAASVRTSTAPNPWVGCVLESPDGRIFEGATAPPGGPHAEAAALALAGDAARGATAWVTLEPCSHHGGPRRRSGRRRTAASGRGASRARA